MTARLMRSLLLGCAILGSSAGHAGGASPATGGPSSALPGDPFGDALPTNKFDPQPVSSPLDQPASSDQQSGAASTGGTSYQPGGSTLAQSQSSDGVQPLSNRVGSRIGKRLASRINNQAGGNSGDVPDPRDSYNRPNAADRVTSAQDAFDSNR